MTFTLSNGAYSYTLPLDPQQWQYNVVPRKSVKRTLGGQVVQLMGYSINGSFGGLLHNHNVSKDQAWADMYAFESFMGKVMLNQRAGLQSHMNWVEQGIDTDCALGDLSISEDLNTVGFTYSMTFQHVSKTGLKTSTQANTMLDMISKEIGFDAGSQWHGGTGDTSRIRQITGFSSTGPSASSSSTGDAQLSQDSSIAEIQEYAKSQMARYGWTDADFNALVQLWNRESGWRWNADNPTSDAYGIPQALPGNKMASAGADWKTNPKTQVNWGLQYISQRYGSPSAAWAHSEATGWY